MEARPKTGTFFSIATGIIIAAYTLRDTVAIAEYQISALTRTFAPMILPTLVLLPKALRAQRQVKREIREHWTHILTVVVLFPLPFLPV